MWSRMFESRFWMKVLMSKFCQNSSRYITFIRVQSWWNLRKNLMVSPYMSINQTYKYNPFKESLKISNFQHLLERRMWRINVLLSWSYKKSWKEKNKGSYELIKTADIQALMWASFASEHCMLLSSFSRKKESLF